MSIRILAIPFLVMGIFLQFALSGEMPPRERMRIGLSLPTLAEERWQRDLDNMVEQAKAMDIELIVQITMHDQYQQILNMEQLITLGADVLIIAPHDSFGAGKAVEIAHDAGLKVISYDRLIFNADVDLFVSYDNDAVGRMQGEYLARKAPKGNYIILGGPVYDSNARFYRDGAMAVLQPLIDRGDITVLLDRNVDNWDTNATKELVESVLAMSPRDVAAILVPNDGMAAGAITALKQRGIEGVVVTGQDADTNAVRRIVEGSQAMTVFKDIAKEVEAALEAAVLLSKGGDVTQLTRGRTVDNQGRDIPAVLLEPVLIQKANLMQVLREAGHIEDSLQEETTR